MKINKNLITIWGLAVVSTLFVLPYTLELQKSLLVNLPVPLYVVVISSVIQSSIMFLIASGIGVFLSNKVGLDNQILGNKLDKELVKKVVISGILISLAIVIGDFLFNKLGASVSIENNGEIDIWKRILACFYGGIAEEILMRLFLMSSLVWILSKFSKEKKNWIYWVAIIIAAILFGIGHLPATAALTAITPMVILRAIVLNGIGGVLFGYIYWKKGIIYAMISHFSADIMLILILPLILK